MQPADQDSEYLARPGVRGAKAGPGVREVVGHTLIAVFSSDFEKKFSLLSPLYRGFFSRFLKKILTPLAPVLGFFWDFGLSGIFVHSSRCRCQFFALSLPYFLVVVRWSIFLVAVVNFARGLRSRFFFQFRKKVFTSLAPVSRFFLSISRKS